MPPSWRGLWADSRRARTAETLARRPGIGLRLARQIIEAHGGKLQSPVRTGAGDRRDHRSSLTWCIRERLCPCRILPPRSGSAARSPIKLRAGDVIALSGGLGAGKTTLARAIIGGLGYRGDVPSPSFAIVELYEPPALRLALVHADFYRLESSEEAREIGLDDYREGAALIAEWPDHAGGFANEPACLSIDLEIAEEGRLAIVEAGKDWHGRLPWQ